MAEGGYKEGNWLGGYCNYLREKTEYLVLAGGGGRRPGNRPLDLFSKANILFTLLLHYIKSISLY